MARAHAHDMHDETSYVFGPVPSRRLGRSLGVDLIPFKTCSYDCIYCQLGRTTNRTVERREWVPLDAVLNELDRKLTTAPDYVTLSGSGEPTLYARTEELIAGIKSRCEVPVAVLTNGGLLSRAEVRRSLLAADLVVPSLDAPDESLFQQVNRPHAEIRFDEMVEGLVALREEFSGDYWLEVFLLEGLTSDEATVVRLAEITQQISPDRVQLNTVARPPAEPDARAVPREKMERLAKLFGQNAEIIADYGKVHEQTAFTARREDVLTMISRRPCTVEDIAAGLALHRNEVVKYVQELLAVGAIEARPQGEKTYYVAR